MLRNEKGNRNKQLEERDCNKRWKKDIGKNTGRKSMEQTLEERDEINVGRKR